MDEETWRLARELAEYRGTSLSEWLARAARRQARVDDGVRAIEEHEAENGPL